MSSGPDSLTARAGKDATEHSDGCMGGCGTNDWDNPPCPAADALLAGGVSDWDGEDDARLTGEPVERALVQSRLDVAGDGLQPDSGLLVVQSRHVDDDLDIRSEDRERGSGHAHNVQHTVSNVKPSVEHIGGADANASRHALGQANLRRHPGSDRVANRPAERIHEGARMTDDATTYATYAETLAYRAGYRAALAAVEGGEPRADDVVRSAFDRVVAWVVRQQNTEWSPSWSEDFKRGYDAALEEVDALVSARESLT